jgi:hypothetical protein
MLATCHAKQKSAEKDDECLGVVQLSHCIDERSNSGSDILHWWLYPIYRTRKEIESNFVSC